MNIGDRQGGRLKASSVIDCGETAEAITAAIRASLSPAFQAGLPATVSPYHGLDVAAKITAVLKRAELSDVIMKRFHDLETHG